MLLHHISTKNKIAKNKKNPHTPPLNGAQTIRYHKGHPLDPGYTEPAIQPHVLCGTQRQEQQVAHTEEWAPTRECVGTIAV